MPGTPQIFDGSRWLKAENGIKVNGGNIPLTPQKGWVFTGSRWLKIYEKISTLTRTASGLLWVRIANDANYPFDTGDYELQQGPPTLSVDGTTGRLEMDTLNGTSIARFSGTGASSRGKRMRQCVVLSPSTDGADFGLPNAVHMETGTGGDSFTAITLYTEGGSFAANIAEQTNGVATSATRGAPTAHSKDSQLRFSLFADGTSYAAYDFVRDHLWTHTGSILTTGHAGIGLFGSAFAGQLLYYYEDWDCTDRYITCTGLTTGYKLKVRNSSSAVLKSATESSGTATLDVIDVSLSDIADIVVTDASDVVVAIYTPASGDYIVGGDTYSF